MPITIDIDASTMDGIREWVKKRPNEIIKELGRAVKFSVIDVERETKRNAPVKTGTLRASTNHFLYKDDLSGEVFSGVEYAIHQEYGTKHFAGKFFMTRAVNSLKPKITKYFELALKRVATR